MSLELLLYEAIRLVPRAHKINEKVAERMFVVNDHDERNKKCPICNQRVEGWFFDDTFQNMVCSQFGEQPRQDPASIHRRLPIDEEEPETPPFPRKLGRFVHTGGDWDKIFHSEGPLNRKMTFEKKIRF